MFTKLKSTLHSLTFDDSKLNNDLIKKEEPELSIETRNLLRKVFLKVLKRTLILKKKIDDDLNIIAQEEMARIAKIDDISIPVFDGINFSSWKFRIMNTLEYKECHEQAKRARAEQENEATWKKSDLKAKTIVISALSDKQLEYVSECTTTYEIMTKLSKMYSTQSTSLQIINRGKLEDVKLKNFSNIEEFFVEFEKASNDLKSAGATLTEEEKMRYLIKALPPSYSYIGDFIDLVPAEQRTVDYVKSKIKEKNLSKPEADKKPSVSTFSANIKGECYKCGKTGHFKRDCWSGFQNQGRGSNNNNRGRGTQGSFRGQRGSSRGRAISQRSNSRGRGRGQQPTTPYSGQPQETTQESWLTRVINVNSNQLSKSECVNENKIEWLLDSG